MKKKLPELKTDEEAEEFVATADLTEYDLSELRPFQFEFGAKSERVNMRLPKALLDAVKDRAARQGLPYQRFIRQVLEAAVQQRTSPGETVRSLAEAGISEAGIADTVAWVRRKP